MIEMDQEISKLDGEFKETSSFLQEIESQLKVVESCWTTKDAELKSDEVSYYINDFCFDNLNELFDVAHL